MTAMRPLIVGNWKMHGSVAQFAEIETIAAKIRAMPPAAADVICLPETLRSRAVGISAGRIAVSDEGLDVERETARPSRSAPIKSSGACPVISLAPEWSQPPANGERRRKFAKRQSDRGDAPAPSSLADGLVGAVRRGYPHPLPRVRHRG